jgi:hypothetical protein
MEMPRIASCNMNSCSFNSDNKCHTMAINVGSHADCKAFNRSDNKEGFDNAIGGIGACLDPDCKFNDHLECSANNVNIGMHNGEADCETFEKRS